MCFFCFVFCRHPQSRQVPPKAPNLLLRPQRWRTSPPSLPKPLTCRTLTEAYGQTTPNVPTIETLRRGRPLPFLSLIGRLTPVMAFSCCHSSRQCSCYCMKRTAASASLKYILPLNRSTVCFIFCAFFLLFDNSGHL